MGAIVSGTGNTLEIVDGDDPSRSAELDSKFNALLAIDIPHHEIHEGDSFVVGHPANSAGFSLCFRVPAGTKRVHMVASWSVEGAGEMQIWEGRGWDASSGTLVTIQNRDRNSANASIVQEKQSTGAFIANSSVNLDPTNVGGGGNPAGVQIQHREVWSNKQRTETQRGVNEFVLKNAEDYVVTFLSNAGAQGILIELDWYEHTDA